MRKRTLAFVASIVLLLSACNPTISLQDAQFLNWYRADNGLPSMVRSSALDIKASVHADRMANAGYIFHSNDLSDGLPDGWRAAGENVGVGGSVEDIERAMIASTRHNENMLTYRWDQFGTAVVERSGLLYLVQVFVDTDGQ